jgi:hypothetical protein
MTEGDLKSMDDWEVVGLGYLMKLVAQRQIMVEV